MPRPQFPKTIIEFQRAFSTEAACHAFVRDSRWPDGFRCPRCGSEDAYSRAKRKQLECKECGHCASVTAGTVMANTKVPLCSWLWAAWLVVSSKGGHSAKELARQIGVTYETAFTMLHRLRHAMVSPDRTLLSGAVEVDESFFGPNGDPEQVTIVGAVEVRDRGTARCRFRVVDEADAESLKGFIREMIEPGSTVVTDGATMYKGLDGYRHEVQIAGKGYARKDVLPNYHIAVSNLRSWLQGTHHGAVSAKHLQAYLNEFCFRYNRRGNLAAAFQTLLGLVPKVGMLGYASLYRDSPPHLDLARKRVRA